MKLNNKNKIILRKTTELMLFNIIIIAFVYSSKILSSFYILSFQYIYMIILSLYRVNSEIMGKFWGNARTRKLVNL